MKFALCRLMALSGLVVLSTLALSACADDRSQDTLYHPHKHHGRGAPDWYRPPAAVQPSR